MNTTEWVPVRLEESLNRLPDFDLEYGVDDRQEPTEVTVYDPGAEDVTTSWLSADAATAVDLADIA
jgi:hypothetical protein